MPCQTCGEALAEDWCDVYCAACLEAVHESLADALLEGFLAHFWDTRRRPRRVPGPGEVRWWVRSA